MTDLEQQLFDLNGVQARRFARLQGASRTIAEAGIIRHLYACDRNGVEPDIGAIREIIDDALNGRAVYAERSL